MQELIKERDAVLRRQVMWIFLIMLMVYGSKPDTALSKKAGAIDEFQVNMAVEFKGNPGSDPVSLDQRLIPSSDPVSLDQRLIPGNDPVSLDQRLIPGSVPVPGDHSLRRQMKFTPEDHDIPLYSGLTSEIEDAGEALLIESLDAFYETEWEKTEQLLKRYLELFPADPRPYFFQSMIPFWEYFFVDQSGETAAKFLERSEVAVRKSEARLRDQPSDTTSILLLSALHGYRSLVAAGEGEYQVAIRSGVRGFSFTRKLMMMDSNRPEVQMGRGLFYYMIGSVGREARWLVNSLGVSADVEMGFMELHKAAQSPEQVSTEAMMMLMYLYQKENRFKDALNAATWLTQKHPGNKIFHFKRGEILESLENFSDAKTSYQQVAKSQTNALERLDEMATERIRQL